MMKWLFAIGAYILGIGCICFGFRGGEWVQILCGLIWVAVGVKNTVLFYMIKKGKMPQKDTKA